MFKTVFIAIMRKYVIIRFVKKDPKTMVLRVFFYLA